ncbi:MAG: TonB-dependent receptor, partial [Sphingobacteriaceae bacterium]
MKTLLLAVIFFICISPLHAQPGSVKGMVKDVDSAAIELVTVGIASLGKGASTNADGSYEINDIPHGKYDISFSAVGYKAQKRSVTIGNDSALTLNISLRKELATSLDEVVVTGTMKEISRTESPIPVEIITPKLFQKNPTPSLFEAVGMVNGVQ